MFTKITHITVFVTNQDDALAFYQKLGFKMHTDASFGDIRWLTLCLPEQPDVEIALIKAEDEQELALVGKQSASKPLLSLETDNCRQDYERLLQAGVTFLEAPTERPWGVAAVMQDIYGNIIYMCQHSA